ncbi:MAG TPA: endo-1,4-beta-xylanase [Bryobacteraceae bacterium]|nr:endo-1,4-beta-xylanase [Bryobacteraceae bacterium]
MYRGSFVLLACSLALSGQPLRELAERRSVRLGTAVNPARLNEELYAGVLAREFNQVEPENGLKFGPVHPQPSEYNFGPPDALAAFAREHKMWMRGHTLVWHQQNPRWVTNSGYTPAQLSTTLREHIQAVVGHYAGQIYAWDVVNEAFNDDGSLRSTVWFDTPGIGLSGTGYIEQALRWAHAADPQARLFYNDYSAERVNAKSDAIYAMARDFRSRGVPLDGIGLQMHFTADPPPLASVEANLKRIVDLGLEVQITELDVRLPLVNGQPDRESLDRQARIYHDIVALCLRYPRCSAIQTWGFTDKYSWIPGTFAGTGAALEYDSNYQPKPAYEAIRNALLGSH